MLWNALTCAFFLILTDLAHPINIQPLPPFSPNLLQRVSDFNSIVEPIDSIPPASNGVEERESVMDVTEHPLHRHEHKHKHVRNPSHKVSRSQRNSMLTSPINMMDVKRELTQIGKMFVEKLFGDPYQERVGRDDGDGDHSPMDRGDEETTTQDLSTTTADPFTMPTTNDEDANKCCEEDASSTPTTTEECCETETETAITFDLSSTEQSTTETSSTTRDDENSDNNNNKEYRRLYRENVVPKQSSYSNEETDGGFPSNTTTVSIIIDERFTEAPNKNGLSRNHIIVHFFKQSMHKPNCHPIKPDKGKTLTINVYTDALKRNSLVDQVGGPQTDDESNANSPMDPALIPQPYDYIALVSNSDQLIQVPALAFHLVQDNGERRESRHIYEPFTISRYRRQLPGVVNDKNTLQIVDSNVLKYKNLDKVPILFVNTIPETKSHLKSFRMKRKSTDHQQVLDHEANMLIQLVDSSIDGFDSKQALPKPRKVKQHSKPALDMADNKYMQDVDFLISSLKLPVPSSKDNKSVKTRNTEPLTDAASKRNVVKPDPSNQYLSDVDYLIRSLNLPKTEAVKPNKVVKVRSSADNNNNKAPIESTFADGNKYLADADQLINSLNIPHSENSEAKPSDETHPINENNKPGIEGPEKPESSNSHNSYLKDVDYLINSLNIPYSNNGHDKSASSDNLVSTEIAAPLNNFKPSFEGELPIVEAEHPIVETEHPIVETEHPIVDAERPIADAPLTKNIENKGIISASNMFDKKEISPTEMPPSLNITAKSVNAVAKDHLSDHLMKSEVDSFDMAQDKSALSDTLFKKDINSALLPNEGGPSGAVGENKINSAPFDFNGGLSDGLIKSEVDPMEIASNSLGSISESLLKSGINPKDMGLSLESSSEAATEKNLNFNSNSFDSNFVGLENKEVFNNNLANILKNVEKLKSADPNLKIDLNIAQQENSELTTCIPTMGSLNVEFTPNPMDITNLGQDLLSTAGNAITVAKPVESSHYYDDNGESVLDLLGNSSTTPHHLEGSTNSPNPLTTTTSLVASSIPTIKAQEPTQLSTGVKSDTVESSTTVQCVSTSAAFPGKNKTALMSKLHNLQKDLKLVFEVQNIINGAKKSDRKSKRSKRELKTHKHRPMTTNSKIEDKVQGLGSILLWKSKQQEADLEAKSDSDRPKRFLFRHKKKHNKAKKRKKKRKRKKRKKKKQSGTAGPAPFFRQTFSKFPLRLRKHNPDKRRPLRNRRSNSHRIRVRREEQHGSTTPVWLKFDWPRPTFKDLSTETPEIEHQLVGDSFGFKWGGDWDEDNEHTTVAVVREKIVEGKEFSSDDDASNEETGFNGPEEHHTSTILTSTFKPTSFSGTSSEVSTTQYQSTEGGLTFNWPSFSTLETKGSEVTGISTEISSTTNSFVSPIFSESSFATTEEYHQNSDHLVSNIQSSTTSATSSTFNEAESHTAIGELTEQDGATASVIQEITSLKQSSISTEIIQGISLESSTEHIQTTTTEDLTEETSTSQDLTTTVVQTESTAEKPIDNTIGTMNSESITTSSESSETRTERVKETTINYSETAKTTRKKIYIDLEVTPYTPPKKSSTTSQEERNLNITEHEELTLEPSKSSTPVFSSSEDELRKSSIIAVETESNSPLEDSSTPTWNTLNRETEHLESQPVTIQSTESAILKTDDLGGGETVSNFPILESTSTKNGGIDVVSSTLTSEINSMVTSPSNIETSVIGTANIETTYTSLDNYSTSESENIATSVTKGTSAVDLTTMLQAELTTGQTISSSTSETTTEEKLSIATTEQTTKSVESEFRNTEQEVVSTSKGTTIVPKSSDITGLGGTSLTGSIVSNSKPTTPNGISDGWSKFSWPRFHPSQSSSSEVAATISYKPLDQLGSSIDGFGKNENVDVSGQNTEFNFNRGLFGSTDFGNDLNFVTTASIFGDRENLGLGEKQTADFTLNQNSDQNSIVLALSKIESDIAKLSGNHLQEASEKVKVSTRAVTPLHEDQQQQPEESASDNKSIVHEEVGEGLHEEVLHKGHETSTVCVLCKNFIPDENYQTTAMPESKKLPHEEEIEDFSLPPRPEGSTLCEICEDAQTTSKSKASTEKKSPNKVTSKTKEHKTTVKPTKKATIKTTRHSMLPEKTARTTKLITAHTKTPPKHRSTQTTKKHIKVHPTSIPESNQEVEGTEIKTKHTTAKVLKIHTVETTSLMNTEPTIANRKQGVNTKSTEKPTEKSHEENEDIQTETEVELSTLSEIPTEESEVEIEEKRITTLGKIQNTKHFTRSESSLATTAEMSEETEVLIVTTTESHAIEVEMEKNERTQATVSSTEPAEQDHKTSKSYLSGTEISLTETPRHGIDVETVGEFTSGYDDVGVQEIWNITSSPSTEIITEIESVTSQETRVSEGYVSEPQGTPTSITENIGETIVETVTTESAVGEIWNSGRIETKEPENEIKGEITNVMKTTYQQMESSTVQEVAKSKMKSGTTSNIEEGENKFELTTEHLLTTKTEENLETESFEEKGENLNGSTEEKYTSVTHESEISNKEAEIAVQGAVTNIKTTKLKTNTKEMELFTTPTFVSEIQKHIMQGHGEHNTEGLFTNAIKTTMSTKESEVNELISESYGISETLEEPTQKYGNSESDTEEEEETTISRIHTEEAEAEEESVSTVQASTEEKEKENEEIESSVSTEVSEAFESDIENISEEGTEENAVSEAENDEEAETPLSKIHTLEDEEGEEGELLATEGMASEKFETGVDSTAEADTEETNLEAQIKGKNFEEKEETTLTNAQAEEVEEEAKTTFTEKLSSKTFEPEIEDIVDSRTEETEVAETHTEEEEETKKAHTKEMEEEEEEMTVTDASIPEVQTQEKEIDVEEETTLPSAQAEKVEEEEETETAGTEVSTSELFEPEVEDEIVGRTEETSELVAQAGEEEATTLVKIHTKELEETEEEEPTVAEERTSETFEPEVEDIIEDHTAETSELVTQAVVADTTSLEETNTEVVEESEEEKATAAEDLTSETFEPQVEGIIEGRTEEVSESATQSEEAEVVTLTKAHTEVEEESEQEKSTVNEEFSSETFEPEVEDIIEGRTEETSEPATQAEEEDVITLTNVHTEVEEESEEGKPTAAGELTSETFKPEVEDIIKGRTEETSEPVTQDEEEEVVTSTKAHTEVVEESEEGKPAAAEELTSETFEPEVENIIEGRTEETSEPVTQVEEEEVGTLAQAHTKLVQESEEGKPTAAEELTSETFEPEVENIIEGRTEETAEPVTQAEEEEVVTLAKAHTEVVEESEEGKPTAAEELTSETFEPEVENIIEGRTEETSEPVTQAEDEEVVTSTKAHTEVVEESEEGKPTAAEELTSETFEPEVENIIEGRTEETSEPVTQAEDEEVVTSTKAHTEVVEESEEGKPTAAEELTSETFEPEVENIIEGRTEETSEPVTQAEDEEVVTSTKAHTEVVEESEEGKPTATEVLTSETFEPEVENIIEGRTEETAEPVTQAEEEEVVTLAKAHTEVVEESEEGKPTAAEELTSETFEPEVENIIEGRTEETAEPVTQAEEEEVVTLAKAHTEVVEESEEGKPTAAEELTSETFEPEVENIIEGRTEEIAEPVTQAEDEEVVTSTRAHTEVVEKSEEGKPTAAEELTSETFEPEVENIIEGRTEEIAEPVTQAEEEEVVTLAKAHTEVVEESEEGKPTAAEELTSETFEPEVENIIEGRTEETTEPVTQAEDEEVVTSTRAHMEVVEESEEGKPTAAEELTSETFEPEVENIIEGRTEETAEPVTQAEEEEVVTLAKAHTEVVEESEEGKPTAAEELTSETFEPEVENIIEGRTEETTEPVTQAEDEEVVTSTRAHMEVVEESEEGKPTAAEELTSETFEPEVENIIEGRTEETAEPVTQAEEEEVVTLAKAHTEVVEESEEGKPTAAEELTSETFEPEVENIIEGRTEETTEPVTQAEDEEVVTSTRAHMEVVEESEEGKPTAAEELTSETFEPEVENIIEGRTEETAEPVTQAEEEEVVTLAKAHTEVVEESEEGKPTAAEELTSETFEPEVENIIEGRTEETTEPVTQAEDEEVVTSTRAHMEVVEESEEGKPTAAEELTSETFEPEVENIIEGRTEETAEPVTQAEEEEVVTLAKAHTEVVEESEEGKPTAAEELTSETFEPEVENIIEGRTEETSEPVTQAEDEEVVTSTRAHTELVEESEEGKPTAAEELTSETFEPEVENIIEGRTEETAEPVTQAEEEEGVTLAKAHTEVVEESEEGKPTAAEELTSETFEPEVENIIEGRTEETAEPVTQAEEEEGVTLAKAHTEVVEESEEGKPTAAEELTSEIFEPEVENIIEGRTEETAEPVTQAEEEEGVTLAKAHTEVVQESEEGKSTVAEELTSETFEPEVESIIEGRTEETAEPVTQAEEEEVVTLAKAHTEVVEESEEGKPTAAEEFTSETFEPEVENIIEGRTEETAEPVTQAEEEEVVTLAKAHTELVEESEEGKPTAAEELTLETFEPEVENMIEGRTEETSEPVTHAEEEEVVTLAKAHTELVEESEEAKPTAAEELTSETFEPEVENMIEGRTEEIAEPVTQVEEEEVVTLTKAYTGVVEENDEGKSTVAEELTSQTFEPEVEDIIEDRTEETAEPVTQAEEKEAVSLAKAHTQVVEESEEGKPTVAGELASETFAPEVEDIIEGRTEETAEPVTQAEEEEAVTLGKAHTEVVEESEEEKPTVVGDLTSETFEPEVEDIIEGRTEETSEPVTQAEEEEVVTWTKSYTGVLEEKEKGKPTVAEELTSETFEPEVEDIIEGLTEETSEPVTQAEEEEVVTLAKAHTKVVEESEEEKSTVAEELTAQTFEPEVEDIIEGRTEEITEMVTQAEEEVVVTLTKAYTGVVEENDEGKPTITEELTSETFEPEVEDIIEGRTEETSEPATQAEEEEVITLNNVHTEVVEESEEGKPTAAEEQTSETFEPEVENIIEGRTEETSEPVTQAEDEEVVTSTRAHTEVVEESEEGKPTVAEVLTLKTFEPEIEDIVEGRTEDISINEGPTVVTKIPKDEIQESGFPNVHSEGEEGISTVIRQLTLETLEPDIDDIMKTEFLESSSEAFASEIENLVEDHTEQTVETMFADMEQKALQTQAIIFNNEEDNSIEPTTEFTPVTFDSEIENILKSLTEETVAQGFVTEEDEQTQLKNIHSETNQEEGPAETEPTELTSSITFESKIEDILEAGTEEIGHTEKTMTELGELSATKFHNGIGEIEEGTQSESTEPPVLMSFKSEIEDLIGGRTEATIETETMLQKEESPFYKSVSEIEIGTNGPDFSEKITPDIFESGVEDSMPGWTEKNTVPQSKEETGEVEHTSKFGIKMTDLTFDAEIENLLNAYSAHITATESPRGTVATENFNFEHVTGKSKKVTVFQTNFEKMLNHKIKVTSPSTRHHEITESEEGFIPELGGKITALKPYKSTMMPKVTTPVAKPKHKGKIPFKATTKVEVSTPKLKTPTSHKHHKQTTHKDLESAATSSSKSHSRKTTQPYHKSHHTTKDKGVSSAKPKHIKHTSSYTTERTTTSTVYEHGQTRDLFTNEDLSGVSGDKEGLERLSNVTESIQNITKSEKLAESGKQTNLHTTPMVLSLETGTRASTIKHTKGIDGQKTSTEPNLTEEHNEEESTTAFSYEHGQTRDLFTDEERSGVSGSNEEIEILQNVTEVALNNTTGATLKIPSTKTSGNEEVAITSHKSTMRTNLETGTKAHSENRGNTENLTEEKSVTLSVSKQSTSKELLDNLPTEELPTPTVYVHGQTRDVFTGEDLSEVSGDLDEFSLLNGITEFAMNTTETTPRQRTMKATETTSDIWPERKGTSHKSTPESNLEIFTKTSTNYPYVTVKFPPTELPKENIAEYSTRKSTTKHQSNFSKAVTFSTTLMLLLSSVYGKHHTTTTTSVQSTKGASTPPSIYVDLPIFVPNDTVPHHHKAPSAKTTAQEEFEEISNGQSTESIILYVHGAAESAIKHLNGSKWIRPVSNKSPVQETTALSRTIGLKTSQVVEKTTTMKYVETSPAKIDLPKNLELNQCEKGDFENHKPCFCAMDNLVAALKHGLKEHDSVNLACSSFLKVDKGLVIGNDSEPLIRRKRSFMFGKLNAHPKREIVDYSKGFFDDEAAIRNTDSKIFTLPKATVIIPCASTHEVVEFNRYMAYSWKFENEIAMPDKQIHEEDGNLLIDHVIPKDAGNYTCTVKSRLSDRNTGVHNYHHRLIVVMPPIYKITTSIMYALNQSCDLTDGDIMATYLPKMLDGLLCGYQEKICTVDVERPRCVNKEEEKLINVTVVVTMKNLSDIVPTIDNNQCRIDCQMKMYSQLASVLVKNIQNFAKLPVSSKIAMKQLEFKPKEMFTDSSEKGHWSTPPILVIICPPGFGVDKTGPKVCIVCPKHTYNNGRGSYCKTCPAGQYQPSPGSRSCLICSSPLASVACLRVLYSNTEYFKLYVGVAFGFVIAFILLILICSNTSSDKPTISVNRRHSYTYSALRKDADVERGANEPLLRNQKRDYRSSIPPKLPPPDF